MARNLAEVRVIHGQLNNSIQHLGPLPDMDEQGLSLRESHNFAMERVRLNAYGLALQVPQWFGGYQASINLLIEELKLLMEPEENRYSPQMKIRLLRLAILAAQQLVEHSLSYLETTNLDTQTQHLPEVVLLQKLIDDGLNRFFQARPKAFNLRLTQLRQEYEQAYVTNHSGGYFGFFTLQIKLIFRQSSRDAELRFIEAIDNYVTEHPDMLSADKEELKISALNSVRFKIQTEFFGENSLLYGLIDERLLEVGAVTDNTIGAGFFEFCRENNIPVPEGLIEEAGAAPRG